MSVASSLRSWFGAVPFVDAETEPCLPPRGPGCPLRLGPAASSVRRAAAAVLRARTHPPARRLPDPDRDLRAALLALDPSAPERRDRGMGARPDRLRPFSRTRVGTFAAQARAAFDPPSPRPPALAGDVLRLARPCHL